VPYFLLHHRLNGYFNFIPGTFSEMEFLDFSLTKDLNPLLNVIHSSFYWRILKKTILFSGFKSPWEKNPQIKKTKVYFMKSIL